MKPSPSVLLASRNPDKIREIKSILQLPVTWLTADDCGAATGADRAKGADSGTDSGTAKASRVWPEVEETGSTFRENAVLKARSLASALGHPAVADDSGLEVRALGGQPGVRSARYAGPERDYAANNEKVLRELAGVSAPERAARFVTVAAYATPDGTLVIAEGEVTGRIPEAPRGAGGFGYDPVFVPDGESRTMAEMTAEEKNAVSHRGRAFRKLAALVGPLVG